jgi:hypothetical protein
MGRAEFKETQVYLFVLAKCAGGSNVTNLRAHASPGGQFQAVYSQPHSAAPMAHSSQVWDTA